MLSKKSSFTVSSVAVSFTWLFATGCTFKFDITSQRTALENQVMGSYKEIDDDVVLLASVRGVSSDGSTVKHEVSDQQLDALRAKQNQEFNRDDLDELKSMQGIGESRDGTVVVLPPGIGQAEKASQNEAAFMKTLIAEENRDRLVVWNRIIQSNHNLSSKDIDEVRKTYAKMQFEAGLVGHWFQDDKNKWNQKASPVKAK